MTRKHPHPDRRAEVYVRQPSGTLVWAGYTDEPIEGAEWTSWGAWIVKPDRNWKERTHAHRTS